MTKIIHFDAYRAFKVRPDFSNIDTLRLLEMMAEFMENYSKGAELTPKTAEYGIYLFEEIQKVAETHELRTLAKKWRNFLEELTNSRRIE